MMEAVRTSETSVDNLFTRQYNPEDSSEHRYSDNLNRNVKNLWNILLQFTRAQLLKDTAQLAVFIQGVNEDFELVEELQNWSL
jgi:hypothetical protein